MASSAAAVRPCFLSSPHRSAAAQAYQIFPMIKFQRKRHIRPAGSHRSRSLVVCRSSGFSAKASTFSRPASAYTHNDLSRIHFFDSLLNTHVGISGYWVGPDMDDGCGIVVAILQRIG
ncbi:uncharacterized protein LOC102703991 [Oryza brachyantha]|nr:uncharacterized protein LOC102703991 [Oryza brachyantha]